jgi:hypothetical protein
MDPNEIEANTKYDNQDENQDMLADNTNRYDTQENVPDEDFDDANNEDFDDANDEDMT